jgi:hypothetical protein
VSRPGGWGWRCAGGPCPARSRPTCRRRLRQRSGGRTWRDRRLHPRASRQASRRRPDSRGRRSGQRIRPGPVQLRQAIPAETHATRGKARVSHTAQGASQPSSLSSSRTGSSPREERLRVVRPACARDARNGCWWPAPAGTATSTAAAGSPGASRHRKWSRPTHNGHGPRSTGGRDGTNGSARASQSTPHFGQQDRPTVSGGKGTDNSWTSSNSVSRYNGECSSAPCCTLPSREPQTGHLVPPSTLARSVGTLRSRCNPCSTTHRSKGRPGAWSRSRPWLGAGG